MRKPDFCLCENKDAVTAQLISAFVFATQKIQNLKLLALFNVCTDRFVSDLVGNPKERFSRVAAPIITNASLIIFLLLRTQLH